MLTGNKYTLPLNRTLYVESKTLTAWTDGTNNYTPGEEITVIEDLSLTPVFTDNTVSLDDRNEEVIITWDFQQKNGAPKIAYEGITGFYVSQAVVNGNTIDVKTDFNTKPGKINNGSWTDWAQMNEGTTFTFPAAKNCIITTEAYNPLSTTTIAGSTDYTSGKIVTYTYGLSLIHI